MIPVGIPAKPDSPNGVSATRTQFARAGRLLWWLVPVFFLLWIDRYGLKCWFMQDDFAWLGLLREVHGSRSLLNALFAPEAQGTIRPWSERGFFLLFESLFGLDSLPFHICVFATMAADAVLVAWITLRITGSRIAGSMAPVLWIANSSLSTVLAWTSAYNEALCALFLLAAMASFIRFAETGRRVFWWWQLVIFILGFGVLEVNVVYPALAAVYALFVARTAAKRLLLSLIPLFCISIVYFVLHRVAAPLPTDGPYAVHVNGRIFQTLATYWKWALIPQHWPDKFLFRARALLWVITAVLAAFSIRELMKRRYRVLFFASWFLISLAPMLPIPEHLTDYYLTIPLIGLSMLGACGIALAWRSWWPWRATALLLVAVWLPLTIRDSLTASQWWLDRSLAVRGMVLGAEAAHEKHPGKAIVLDAVTSALYDDAISQSGFYPTGFDDVYLTPGSQDTIQPAVNPELLQKMTLAPAVMKNAITHDSVVLYSVVGDRLQNITEAYERSALERFLLDKQLDQEPRRVDVGSPLFAYLLGPEWFGVESGARWMPRRATVRLAGPGSAKDRLILEGYCPDSQLKAGIVHLSVSVDGIPLAAAQIGEPGDFRRVLDLPPSLIGKPVVEVAIAVDRVTHEPGGRELGLVFGTVAIQ